MKPIISTEIDDQNPVHTRIKVWNRGRLAGTLVVNTSDAAEIISRLEGDGHTNINQEVGVIERGAVVTGVSIGNL